MQVKHKTVNEASRDRHMVKVVVSECVLRLGISQDDISVCIRARYEYALGWLASAL